MRGWIKAQEQGWNKVQMVLGNEGLRAKIQKNDGNDAILGTVQEWFSRIEFVNSESSNS